MGCTLEVVPLNLGALLERALWGQYKSYIGNMLGYPSWGYDLRGTTKDPMRCVAEALYFTELLTGLFKTPYLKQGLLVGGSQ